MSQPKGETRTSVWLPVLAAAATAAGIVTCIALVAFREPRAAATASGTAGATASRLAVNVAMLADPRVGAIAGEFLCPCGGCGIMELRDCECDMPRGALEAKARIAELLRLGNAPAVVAERMAVTYGSRKPSQSAAPGAQTRASSPAGGR